MMRFIGTAAAIVLVAAFMVVGCQRDESPTGAPNSLDLGGLQKLSIPPGSTLVSATLYIYQRTPNPGDPYGTGYPVYVHRITADWAENTVTWNNFGNQYDPAVIGSFTTFVAPGWQSVDVTGLVAGWIAETYPNYGLLIRQNPNQQWTAYNSSEETTNRPYLQICYTFGGSPSCVIIRRGVLGEVADSRVWELPAAVDANWGSDPVLYTGNVNGYEKYSMIRFDFINEGTGCTYTPGYWKTHSQHGPASFDDGWNEIVPSGADSPFFLSGQTWYQVFWTTPSNGNAYYILAHQYMAAKLNLLNGASSLAEVAAAIAWAETFFATYTPSSSLSRTVRNAAISYAATLDRYNNGFIGPGHCN